MGPGTLPTPNCRTTLPTTHLNPNYSSLIFPSKVKTMSAYSDAETCVFWDSVDCPIPEGHDVGDVTRNIKKALENSGYHGAASIRAYGDINPTENDFIDAGIELKCVPAGGDKDDRLEGLLVDFLCWVIDHREPVNIMLILGDISGHREFIKPIICLGQIHYNFLLSEPQTSSGLPNYAVRTKWLWKSLSTGGDPFDDE